MSPPAPPSPRRVAILANPAAGRHDDRALADIAAALERRGFAVERIESRAPGDLAAAAAAVEAETIAVAGGDGTLHEVVGALVGRDEPRPRLAVIPQGTANVLAHEYRLPKRAEAIAAAIAAGRTRPLHLGAAGPEGRVTRPFFLMVSAGVDAAVVRAVETGVRRRFKKLAFVAAALRRAFAAADGIRVEVVSEPGGSAETFDTALAIVTKAAHYGGPFRLTTATGCDRPGLRLVALRRAGPWALFRAGLDLATGRIERSANVIARDAAGVRLAAATPGGAAPVQIDGEPAGETPIAVTASPTVLQLIVA